MKLGSTVPLFAAVASSSARLFVSMLHADAAGSPTVCESSDHPVELVSETNAPLRLRCGLDFPDLVPADGRAFAVDADGICGVSLVDPEKIKITMNPSLSSDLDSRDARGHLMRFSNSSTNDTKICFRCARALEAENRLEKPGARDTSEDTCIIFVTVKAKSERTGAEESEDAITSENKQAVGGSSSQNDKGREEGHNNGGPQSEGSALNEDTTNVNEGQRPPNDGTELHDPQDDNQKTKITSDPPREPNSNSFRICRDAVERIQLLAKQQTTFGCDSSMTLRPTNHNEAFLSGDNESCSGSPVALNTILEGATLTADEASGQHVYTFNTGSTNITERKDICYICSAQDSKRQCKVLITLSNAVKGAPTFANLGLSALAVIITFAHAF